MNLKSQMRRNRKAELKLSAGGIVFLKEKGDFKFLILEKDKGNGKKEWLFPKGKIEENESTVKAALREISEESGLPQNKLKVIKKIGQERFFYKDKWDKGQLVYKIVEYFLVEYSGKKKPLPQKEEGFIRAVFLPKEEVLNRLTFKNSKNLFKKALKELENGFKN